MAPPLPPRPPRGSLPSLERYADYRDWLARVLAQLQRDHEAGVVGKLAGGIGCSQAHLTNIAKKRRRLRSPFLEALAAALGLSERRTRLLGLLVASVHARTEKQRIKAEADLTAYREEPESAEAAASTAAELASPVTEGVLRALADAGGLRGELPELAERLWPRPTRASLAQLGAEILRRSGGLGPSRSALRAPTARQIPDVVDVIRCARMALNEWPLGRRLLRFSVWLLPDGAWPAALAAEVEDFQTELEAWASSRRAEGGPHQVMRVQLQVTPITASVAGSGRAKAEGFLRNRKHPDTDTKGASPAGMVDHSQQGRLPSTFGYDDYRPYLEAVIDVLQARVPAGRPPFTVGTLAQRVGCRPQILTNTLSKHRRFPLKYHDGLIRVLGLDAAQAADFALLVEYTHSRSPSSRAQMLRRRMVQPEFRAARPVHAAAMEMFSDLLHNAIYELARHPQFRADPEWIGATLNVPWTAARISQTLVNLQTLGALIVDAEGTLRPADASLCLPVDANRDLARALHLTFLDHAARMVATAPTRTSQAAQAVAIPVSDLPELVDRVRAFHARLDARCQEMQSSVQGAAWAVQIFTLQLFPGTKPLTLGA